MKKVLISKEFDKTRDNTEGLSIFVNKNNIKPEDIQQITDTEYAAMLYFWGVVKPETEGRNNGTVR